MKYKVNRSKESYAKAGKIGGSTTLKKYGVDHFKKANQISYLKRKSKTSLKESLVIPKSPQE